MQKSIGRFAVVAVGGVAATASGGSAGATPVVVTETINLGQLLQAGGSSLNGTFNINGLVAGQGSGPFNVLSGSITAFGFSDAQYAPVVSGNFSGYNTNLGSFPYVAGYYYTPQIGQYVDTYNCGWSTCNTYYYTYATGPYPIDATGVMLGQSYDLSHIDATADQLLLTAGGSSSTGTAGTLSNSTSGYSGYTFTTHPSPGTVYYDRVRDTYSAISGEVDTTLALGLAALASLATGGMLDYTLSAPTGHVATSSLVLSMLVDVVDVTEPGSLAIMVVGLGAAGLASRRRQRTEEPSA